MKKLVLAAIILVVLAIAGGYSFMYFRYFAPSANMEDYRSYYVNDTGIPKDGAVRVTFLGTTTLLLDDGETQLMIDGFFTRPGMWKAGRSTLSTDTALVDSIVARLKIDRLRAVFVAHSHIDHAFDVPYLIKRTGAKLHGSPSTLNIGRGGGLREEQMVAYEPGNELKFGEFAVTILNAKHSNELPGVNSDIVGAIDEPLVQPARLREYKEGGSYDMLIKRGTNSLLVKASSNYIPGAFEHVRANVVFLGVMTLGKRHQEFQNAFYDESIGKLKPSLVIPIHWDNFFLPLSENLEAANRTFDDLQAGLDFVIDRTRTDGISFKILQGYQSILIAPPPW